MDPEKKKEVTTTEPSSTAAIAKTPAASQPLIRNIRPTYNAQGTPVLEPLTGSTPPPLSKPSRRETVIALPHQQYSRKRGPSKLHGPQGCMSFSSQLKHSAVTSSISEAPPKKRGRGRGRGITKMHKMEAPLGSARRGFIPHVITVQAGEEVSSKLMSSSLNDPRASQNGPRAICVLSGSGAISTVTLRHTASSGGTTTYEGLFDILSISGSFSLSEENGQQSRTGGLSISLACQNGQFLGGVVAGPLIAASPVQIIVGNFIEEERRDPNATNGIEPLSATQKFIPDGKSTGPSSNPPSRGTHSKSPGRSGISALNHKRVGN